MKRNDLIRCTLCLLIAALLLAGCGRSAPAATPSAEDLKPETDVVRLAYTLELSANGHIFNAIAEQQGYLEDEGIRVEHVMVANDAAVFKAIQKGQIDVASNSGTNLPLQQIAEGMDLTIFGGYMLTGCMPLFSLVDTEWDGLEDLVGKTVACEPNLYAITGPLLDMGYDPLHDIHWLETENQIDRIKAVESGEADFGVVGTTLNYEVNTNPNIKILAYASDFLPNYSCCRVEAPTDWINEHPNTVRALLKAWIRAMAYYDLHHDETVEMVARLTYEEEAIIRAYIDNPHYDMNVDPMKRSVERAWNYMRDMGLFSKEAEQIDIDDHINVELYKQALDACQEQYGSENPKFYERMQAQFALYNN